MSLAIGLNGLSAAMRRLDAAAWDVARSGAGRVNGPAEASASGGVGSTSAVAVDGTLVPPASGASGAPAAGLAAPGASTPAPDLVGAMIELRSAGRAVLANLQTLRRSDEVLETLLKSR